MTTLDERRTVVASQPGVADAAAELPAGASAVDRVVAGVLAAVALSPGVLFGPVQLLLAGGGLGTLAIDGRVRQPGKGAPRPRGFVDGDDIPDAAWVAATALPAALAATVALVRTTTLTRLAGPAIEIAKDRSEGRTKLLRGIGRRGAGALTERAVADELVASFGRTAGGLLTVEDFAEPAITAEPAGPRVPWLATEAAPARDTIVHVIAAGDARGRFAVACYEDAHEGIAFDAFDLVMPRLAEPVRRGQTRVSPGAARPAPAPIGLVLKAGAVESAIGRPRDGRNKSEGEPFDALLEKAREGTWAVPRGVLGVIRTRTGARAITSTTD